ncbi:MAG: thiamine pyrophosphate-binding protein [Pirellulales bacterium]
MISGEQVHETLVDLGIDHVVWLPDSALGPWETALAGSRRLKLVRVCREAEAWLIAAGLQIGGRRPLVVMQTTGLYDSGDALRNVFYDMEVPLFALIGHRSYLLKDSTDSAKRFAEPILQAWGLDARLIERPDQWPLLTEHYRACTAAGRPGAVLLAEGAM